MTLATFGNLFLIFVIFRGNHAVRRRISPVQLLLLHTCAADLLFALLTLGTEILTLVGMVRVQTLRMRRTFDSEASRQND
ncbi:hypothetical protein ANCDUO_19516 [Ancylostoma duodenale]|uniref:Uncharacterized protein n=1 Tax=Ancylostoma duodenale TaxID=51022 RepID=A0A0C2FPF6_9BILA|nr:hypothetical protein ANCDUO_19516 [Ancylostoma duodenale]